MAERTLEDDAELLTRRLCTPQEHARKYDTAVQNNTDLEFRSVNLSKAAVDFAQYLINLRTRGQRKKKG